MLKNDLEVTDPKGEAGRMKPGLSCTPPHPLFLLGLAMEEGAAKYGRFNWRETGVCATTYYDAALRHLAQWFEGADADRGSGVPHLAHVMACCAILLDARHHDTLCDDRPITPGRLLRDPIPERTMPPEPPRAPNAPTPINPRQVR